MRTDTVTAEDTSAYELGPVWPVTANCPLPAFGGSVMGSSVAKLVPPEERYHVPGNLGVSTSTVQFLRGGRVTGAFCVL